MIGQLALDRPILVVDDTNSTRYSTRRILVAAGAEVVEAISGQEALELAPGCGAIVLDVNLPDMDGFQVCRALRAAGVNAHVPIVHLTAQRLRDEDKIRGLEAGADAYLTHPVDPGVLIATLNALLRTREAEQLASRSRERFEAVFRTAPVGIALVATDGALLETNAELDRMFALAPGVGHSTKDLPGALHDALASFRDGHGPDRWSNSIRAAGAAAPMHVDCRVACIGSGAALLLVTDNTQRRTLELEREELLERERSARTQAEDASRAKDAFLALLSHELRNPLAPIDTAAQLLQMSAGDESRVRETSNVIVRQVQHMTRLVNDLLDVSRVTRGLVQLHMDRVDVTAVLAAAVEQAHPLIQQRHHELVVSAPPRPALVRGDRTRLVQVVTNLLNNAAKYTPPGGRIELTLQTVGADVHIRVSDNGSGISGSLLPNIFELFTQGERTPDRSEGGLGIGLALVKSIIVLHGGTVEATSEGTGCGSAFTVVLPVLTGAAADVPVPDVTADAAPGATRVLLVDDNVDAASTLAELLELSGHDVDVAHDATAALERVQQQAPYEAFVLDIGLPGMTGHELASQLRQRLDAANAIFIALTGYGQAQDRMLSREAGFDHHLVKPVDTFELLGILSSAHGPDCAAPAAAANPPDSDPRAN